MSDSRTTPDIHRKPASGAHISHSSLATIATARTSEDTKSDSTSSYLHRGTGSTTPLSSDQTSPFSETTPYEFPSRDELGKVSAMPSSPPPPPRPTVLRKTSTPPRIPAVTATQATPRAGTRSRDRSPAAERPPSRANKPQPNRLQPLHGPPTHNAHGRSVSVQQSTTRGASADSPRVVSNPIDSRLQSMQSGEGNSLGTAEKKKVKKSWFPGGRSKHSPDELAKTHDTGAWLISPDNRADYSTVPLLNGDPVPELWNEQGNVFVYLHPKGSGRGPSFKVADHVFSTSVTLNELLVAEMMAAAQYLGVEQAERPVIEGHLYLPSGSSDLQSLVSARNLFAFLTHQPLVGTKETPSLFSAVLQLSSLLREFNFSNYDGSSFGESVDVAFDQLVDQFGLADVRHSGEKTLEALVLAEQMKSWNLYNEAFAHAVGKYESLLDLRSPIYPRISTNTRKRLERAHLDLVNRQANVNARIESFEFPSLFAGIASSTSTEEYRNVKFKEWKNNFGKMRSFVLNYYKGLFGSWPPKARSRKNHFSQSGLNRQCLKILYSDLCALYDLLVDRKSITPRVIAEADGPSDDAKEKNGADPSISALRKILSEFEKSSPPVLPPIPYDIPKIPSMTAIYENYNELPAKKQAKYNKSLQSHELQLILIKSRNMDTDALQMPFLAAFKDFELREARGVQPQDLADQRIGFWLFLYVVLQSLPMLVVDAPGLQFTEGVEDFLCEAPQGNPPWTEDAGEVRKMWYQTADQNFVELSADVLVFSVEGIYTRSHCWLVAKEWEAAASPALAPAAGSLRPSSPTSLQPPHTLFPELDPFATGISTNHNLNIPNQVGSGGGLSAPNSPHLRPRSGSHDHRARHALRASMAIGLEPLPIPAVGAGDRTSRIVSAGSGLFPSAGGGYGPGGGPGDMYQLGLRTSRSAVNLNQFGELGPPGEEAGQLGFAPRRSVYGGLPPPAALGGGHVRGASHGGVGGGAGGGSTFDDILKGMDNGKKAKKKLFF